MFLAELAPSPLGRTTLLFTALIVLAICFSFGDHSRIQGCGSGSRVDPLYFGKLDPDPHLSEKLDPDTHTSQDSGDLKLKIESKRQCLCLSRIRLFSIPDLQQRI
jgi:hypothetical protein